MIAMPWPGRAWPFRLKQYRNNGDSLLWAQARGSWACLVAAIPHPTAGLPYTTAFSTKCFWLRRDGGSGLGHRTGWAEGFIWGSGLWRARGRRGGPHHIPPPLLFLWVCLLALNDIGPRGVLGIGDGAPAPQSCTEVWMKAGTHAGHSFPAVWWTSLLVGPWSGHRRATFTEWVLVFA